MDSFARECDGFLCASSAAYESESLHALRSWLAETSRPVYTIGPLVPPGFGDAAGLSSVAKQKEIDSSKNGGEFQIFLDKTLKSHGEHSLIYVRKQTNHVSNVKYITVLTPFLYFRILLGLIWNPQVAEEE